MIEASVSEIKANFFEYLNRAIYGQERVVITSQGKPEAVLMSFEELRRFENTPATIKAHETGDIPTKNQRLLELLRTSPNDDKEAWWWAEFEQELAQNRLSFRVIE